LGVELVDCNLTLSVSFSFFCKQKQAREILLLTTPGVRITCPSSYELSNKKSTKELLYHKRKASWVHMLYEKLQSVHISSQRANLVRDLTMTNWDACDFHKCYNIRNFFDFTPFHYQTMTPPMSSLMWKSHG